MASQGRWIAVSPALAAAFGCQPAECLAFGWRRFVLRDDQRVWRDIANDLQAGRFKSYLMRFKSVDGVSILTRLRFLTTDHDGQWVAVGQVEILSRAIARVS